MREWMKTWLRFAMRVDLLIPIGITFLVFLALELVALFLHLGGS